MGNFSILSFLTFFSTAFRCPDLDRQLRDLSDNELRRFYSLADAFPLRARNSSSSGSSIAPKAASGSSDSTALDWCNSYENSRDKSKKTNASPSFQIRRMQEPSTTGKNVQRRNFTPPTQDKTTLLASTRAHPRLLKKFLRHLQ